MRRLLTASAIALGLVACLPTPPCACPPAVFRLPIGGIVAGPDGEPLPGVRVSFRALQEDCTPYPNRPPHMELGRAVTDSRGIYATRLVWPEPKVCIDAIARLEVEGAAPDSAVAGPIVIGTRDTWLPLAFPQRPADAAGAGTLASSAR